MQSAKFFKGALVEHSEKTKRTKLHTELVDISGALSGVPGTLHH